MTAPCAFPPVRGDAGAAWCFYDLMDAHELDRIELARERLEPAKTADGAVYPTMRDSNIAWLHNGPEWSWLFAKLHYLAHLANTKFKFDLWGIVEPLQLSEYGEGGHFDWHVDDGVPGAPPRKLSFTLQLSDPASYEGGDLELWGLGGRHTMSRERGSLIFFPSYTLHRVTPVTRGVRRSLVVWVTGRQFS